jgi:splicing factor 3A subunit 1
VIGPQLGAAPAEMPPAQAAGAQTPGGGTAFTGAVLSAGPSAPSALQPVNPYGQFMPFHDQPAFDPSIFNSSPMPSQMQPMAPPSDASTASRPAAVAMHPSRMAALGGPPAFGGGSPIPPIAGQTRPFEAINSPAEDPTSKRPRVDKLPGGQYYPVSTSYRFCRAFLC